MESKLVPEVNIGVVGHVAHGKCIALDENILLNNRFLNGVELLKLSKSRGKLIYSNGKEWLYEIPRLRTYSLSTDLKVVKSKAWVFVQRYRGLLLKVLTKSGREIKVTPAHPLLVNAEGKLEWREACKIRVGNRIAILNFVPPSGMRFGDEWAKELRKKYWVLTQEDFAALKKRTKNFTDFSLASAQDFNNLRLLGDFSCSELATFTGLSSSSIEKVLAGAKEMGEELRKSLAEFFLSRRKRILHLHRGEVCVKARKLVRFKDVKRVDDGLVKWFAFLHAKARVKAGSISIPQSPWLSEFERITREKFGIQCRKELKENGLELRIDCTPFVSYLQAKFGIGKGIPWLISLPLKLQFTFIKHFFEMKGNRARISRVSKRSANILSTVLNNCKIPHRLKSKKRKYSILIQRNGLEKIFGVKSSLVQQGFGRKKSTSSISWDEVRMIIPLPYNGYVIDLVVPTFQNFAAGFGIICHNTTLVKALTGRLTLTHSEELKRGITIRLGYADATIYKCEQGHFGTSARCKHCFAEARPERTVSFVDAPGHETLMATVLTGAALMDGALLVIAANEPCPQPQTREHLMALKLVGIERLVVVQNKVDLVDESRALENCEEIKRVLEEFGIQAPIIPVSAQQAVGIERVVEAIQRFIPTPARPAGSLRMLVARSFDVNKPGTRLANLCGGVLGGAVMRGKVKLGEDVEIRPGVMGKPLITKVIGLKKAGIELEEAGPGGLLGLATELDPGLTKADAMVGNVVGVPGQLPPLHYELELEVSLLERLLGLKELKKVEALMRGEALMINAGTARSLAQVVGIKGSRIELKLNIPVCVEAGERVTLSRQIGGRWRLIGYGTVI